MTASTQNGGTVIIVGAGATVAEVASKRPIYQPPLDSGFFNSALKVSKKEALPIVDFLRDEYNRDFGNPDTDSLEAAMVLLYSITGKAKQEKLADEHLANLVLLFANRIAKTTNGMNASPRSKLYRLILSALTSGIDPSDLTMLTLNQDLQIEKVLMELHNRHYRRYPSRVLFAFPQMYRLTGAVAVRSNSRNDPAFPTTGYVVPFLEVLKLHGSFNWYSVHRSPKPKRTVLFKPTRKLHISDSRTIRPTFLMRHGLRSEWAWPIIIPPVAHKSGVLQKDVHRLWAHAEDRLSQASRVIIYGYSCPETDLESATLIGRSLNASAHSFALHIIDPNPATVARFYSLTHCPEIHYYNSVKQFLTVAKSVFA